MKPAAIAFSVFMVVCLAVVLVVQVLRIDNLVEEQQRLKKRMDNVVSVTNDAKEIVTEFEKLDEKRWNTISHQIIRIKKKIHRLEYGEDLKERK